MAAFGDDLVAHVQSVAIATFAWRGSDAVLAELLGKSLHTDQLDQIRRLLHSKPLASALSTRDVLLWTGHDGLIRLIDAQPVGYRAAVLRTQHHPGPSACRFCLTSEPVRLDPELVPERDSRGEVVAGSFVHPACAVPWARLRAQAAQREVAS